MEKIFLNEGWEFTKEFGSEEYQKIRIPHTVVETEYNYFDESVYQMISGYKRVIVPQKEWENKQVLLTFEGAAHEATVYANKKEIGVHSCGYTAFSVDLSEFVTEKEIIIEVKLDSREELNIPPFGLVIDYMTYGGIYRDVYLEISDMLHTVDLFAKPQRKGEGKYHLEVEHTLSEACKGKELTLEYELVEKKSGEVVEAWNYAGVIKSTKFHTQRDFSQIKEWSVDDPNMYLLRVRILENQEKKDSRDISFGFREARFCADGFYLNGEKIKIRGLNRHQAYPYVGYAMPKSMQEMDADVLKEELALNAVRTSHYPQSQYFVNRCDEIGLLVFTEIPGWQHLGDEEWKNQAVKNVEEMVLQYRNHPSIILWGVRINESLDDDDLYTRTNAVAHELDSTRQTGGVRYLKKSHLLEDVYTYNDFLHNGVEPGCDPKKNVTSDMEKGYLISEYNGHMYPTKMFDDEEQRREHVMRHANVLEAVAKEEDIAGSFGWCMADYNTHKDFGSGDRICYHGVLDMYRNPKPAAGVYTAQGSCEKRPFLSICSSMDIGEHPACNRTETYMLTNADAIRMYKNDRFIKEYDASESVCKHLRRGPIAIDDYIGDAIEKGENFKPKQAMLVKEMLNHVAINGMKTTPKLAKIAAKLVAIYHMDPKLAVPLYNKYVGDWGEKSKSYKFEAIYKDKVVATVTKTPMTKMQIRATVSGQTLHEENSYDVAAVRLIMADEYDNQLFFYGESAEVTVEGPLELIGPKAVAFRGGAAGLYVKTTGELGTAKLHIRANGAMEQEIEFQIV